MDKSPMNVNNNVVSSFAMYAARDGFIAAANYSMMTSQNIS